MRPDVAPDASRIRDHTPAEIGFIRETSAKARQPRMGVSWIDWYASHGPLIDTWMAQGQTRVYAIDDVILGFGIESHGILRMLYVKKRFRGKGIGLAIVRDMIGRKTVYGDGTTRLTDTCVVFAMVVYRPTSSFRMWARVHDIQVRECISRGPCECVDWAKHGRNEIRCS